MSAKEFLQQAYEAHKEMEVKLEQLERLRSLAVSTTSRIHAAVPIKGSKGDSRIEKAVALIDEQTNRLADDIINLMEINKAVATAIAQVKSVSERAVLEYRYLSFFSWQQVSTLMKTSISNVFKIHANALKNFPYM